MADVLTDDPKLPRAFENHFILIADGYDFSVRDLIALMTEGLAQVPEQYRESAWLTYPGEDDSEWNIAYKVMESDESYAARLKKHQREKARYHNKALSELQLAKKTLDEAVFTRDRRAATHKYEYALRVAKEYGVDTAPYE